MKKILIILSLFLSACCPRDAKEHLAEHQCLTFQSNTFGDKFYSLPILKYCLDSVIFCREENCMMRNLSSGFFIERDSNCINGLRVAGKAPSFRKKDTDVEFCYYDSVLSVLNFNIYGSAYIVVSNSISFAFFIPSWLTKPTYEDIHTVFVLNDKMEVVFGIHAKDSTSKMKIFEYFYHDSKQIYYCFYEAQWQDVNKMTLQEMSYFFKNISNVIQVKIDTLPITWWPRDIPIWSDPVHDFQHG